MFKLRLGGMTTIIVATVLIVNVSARAERSQSPKSLDAELPFFEFKGVIAGSSVAPVGDCKVIGPETLCTLFDEKVAGQDVIGIDRTGPSAGPKISFYNGRLSGVLFKISDFSVRSILEAFVEKYGKPCATGIDKWQSKAGAVFDNPSYMWCFRTGKLTLSSMSDTRDSGIVSYQDDNRPPPDRPKVDF